MRLLRLVSFALVLSALQIAVADSEENNQHGLLWRRRGVIHPLRDGAQDSKRIKYNCWEPKSGLSSPVVTIVTIMLSHNLAQKFVNQNRLPYILRHGYRYCELNVIADKSRIAAFSKLPLMLSLLPCTDFIVHVDGDAVIVNHALSFGPWIAHMQAKNVDLLLSADCIVQSPINFGVFMMRPAPWLLTLFKELYNRCACDWSRLHDWPAEQGMLYDILVERMKEPWFPRAQVARFNGWNRFYYDGWNGTNMLRDSDLVVHMTGIPKFRAEGDCGPDPTCKFQEIQKYYAQAVADKIIPKPLDYNITRDFNPTTCLPIVYKTLLPSEKTYHNRAGDRVASSFMDWAVTPRGYVSKIILGEISCIGYRESKCNLKFHWDMKTGKGPWMPQLVHPLQDAPLDKQWSLHAHRHHNSTISTWGRRR